MLKNNQSRDPSLTKKLLQKPSSVDVTDKFSYFGGFGGENPDLKLVKENPISELTNIPKSRINMSLI